jgi:REP element-mobilizing transposase RayT
MKTVKGLVKHERWRLSHVEAGGATYFLTFAALPGESFSSEERGIILKSCRHGDPAQWILHGAVVMPDHAHLLLTPVFMNSPSQTGWISLSDIVKGIKSVTARKINKLRGRRGGSFWQDEYYDRMVRDEADFAVKVQYMKNNPVKVRLAARPENWDALWISENAEERCRRFELERACKSKKGRG